MLIDWRITLETGNNDLDEDAQELAMQLSSMYMKWREETLQEGKAEVAVNLIKSGMSCEQAAQMMGLPMELVLQLARESEEASH
jgi:predicted transposase YdaD